MRKMLVCAAAPIAALLAAGSGAAFEPFNTFLAVVDAEVTGNEAFHYAAPHRPIPTYQAGDPLIWPSDQALLTAMGDPAPATAMTGVNFLAATGVFVAGLPPSTIAILQGHSGFATGAPAVLAERGYEESTVSGFRVFAFGEDYAVNRETFANGDPFGGRLGKSQRLAIADEYVVQTFSWGDANRVLERLETPDDCVGCLPWRALSNSIETVAQGSTLEAAVGFDVSAFAVAFDPADLFGPNGELIVPDPDKAPEENAEPIRALPPFLYAILAVTREGGVATVHIAALFPDETTAETGGSVIAERIATAMATFEASDPALKHEEIAVEAAKADLGATAVVSVQFPLDNPDGALRYYVRWLNMIYSREFAVLSVFEGI